MLQKIKKRHFMLLSCTLIFMLSIAGMSTYFSYRETDTVDNLNLTEFMRELYISNLVHTKTLYNLSQAAPVEMEDGLLSVSDAVDKTSEAYEELIQTFRKTIAKMTYAVEDDLKNLQYLVIDEETKQQVTNTTYDLKRLFEENSHEYRWYMRIRYDALGIIRYDVCPKDASILSDGLIQSFYEQYFYFLQDANRHMEDYMSVNDAKAYAFQLQPLTNMTMYYAIPTILRHEDSISRLLEKQIYMNTFRTYDAMYLSMIILCLFLWVYPKRALLAEPWVQKLMLYPPEVVFIGLITLFFIFFGMLSAMTYSTVGMIFETNNVVVNTGQAAASIAAWMMNALMWTAQLTVTAVLAVYTRVFFRHPQYRAHSSLRSVIAWLKQELQSDLSKKQNSLIVKLLLLNCILMLVGSTLPLFFPIAYSIVLYLFAQRFYSHYQKNYSKIYDAASKMAKGNLDVRLEEDVGVFNNLLAQLAGIQSGFQLAVDDEVKSQKMKTELISNVSHDLKTPLTTLITYINLLQTDTLSEEERTKYIQVLNRNATRLKHLIDDLFEVSKAQSGDIQLHIVEVDIISLLHQTQYEMEDLLAQKGLQLRFSEPEGKCIMALDSQKTYRVFENLFSNIVKYSMPQTRVYILVEHDENSVDIHLKNMAEFEMDFQGSEIVERFARGDKSRHSEGSGLGLAIAKSFVELQKGRMTVTVEGDMFKVHIHFPKA